MYRATLPFPQVGAFLRCAGLAGEAFFTLADRARPEIEPLLRAELGPDLAMEWGASHRPEMTNIAAILAAPLPWNDRGGTADCMDASGRRRVVELFRVPGRRSGGEQHLPREGEEACPCKGRAPRAERLSHEADHETQCLG